VLLLGDASARALMGWVVSPHPARAIISTPVLSCQGGKDALTRQNGCEGASDRGGEGGLVDTLVAWFRASALRSPLSALRSPLSALRLRSPLSASALRSPPPLSASASRFPLPASRLPPPAFISCLPPSTFHLPPSISCLPPPISHLLPPTSHLLPPAFVGCGACGLALVGDFGGGVGGGGASGVVVWVGAGGLTFGSVVAWILGWVGGLGGCGRRMRPVRSGPGWRSTRFR